MKKAIATELETSTSDWKYINSMSKEHEKVDSEFYYVVLWLIQILNK